MSRIVALGEARVIEVFALAGAEVVAADDQDSVRAAWEALPDDAAVVILTQRAAAALEGAAPSARIRLVAVVPA